MSRRVLIIIDVQKGFVTRHTQKVVDNIQKHLNSTHYDVVIQSRWENYMGSLYEERLGYHAVGNTAETDMVIKDHTDHVITRTAYSCITDRCIKLLQKDDEIYVCGLETDACVMGTCFSLWDLGYHFYVLEKCTGTNAKDLNDAAFKMMRRQFGKDSVV